MKKFILMAAVAASTMTVATAANALSVTSVRIDGAADAAGLITTGTVWDTTINGFYLAVLTQPLSNILNGNDPATISVPVTTGANNFGVFGDGFPTNTSGNSDLFYKLTLGFDDSNSVTGVYNTVANSFTGSTSGGITLTGFLWERQGGNLVSEYSSAVGGAAQDYSGSFAFNSAAVPEPATWAMMIGGFGLVGAAMRRTNKSVKTVTA